MELFTWFIGLSLLAWGAFVIHKVLASSEHPDIPKGSQQSGVEPRKPGLQVFQMDEASIQDVKAPTLKKAVVIEVVPSKRVAQDDASRLRTRESVSPASSPARRDQQKTLFEFDIVGESRRQAALEAIAGPRGAVGKEHVCTATVSRERSNDHDPNALVVKISGRKVGYISRQDNKRLIAELGEDGFPLTVPAIIVGGWKSGRSEGSYGVRLALPSNSPPASSRERAMVKYVDGKLPRGLTERQAKNRLKAWKKESNDRFDQWEYLEEITEHLQSADGRLEFDIKKPTAKAITEAFDALIAEGLEIDDFDADEVVEKMLAVNQGLAR